MSYLSSAANQGLLAYGITTNPDPIQASPKQGDVATASIVITVSNNTDGNIYCKKLTFSFPIGDLAQDLSSSSTGILVSANPSSKWQISMTSSGVFTATPVTPEDNKITTDGLSFQIYNIQVNKEVGTFTFSVVENSSTNGTTYTDKTNNYNLTKFPYGFYVNNFAVSAPMVDDGSPVTLTWSGSDLGAYTIMYGTHTVDVTDVRSWTSPNLTDTTTFALKATVQSQGDTVDTYLYVTVIVSNPELIAKSLQVSEKVRIDDGLNNLALSIGGDPALQVDAPGTAGGRFTVQSHANNGYVGINNANPSHMLDVNGDLNITGATSLESLITSGTVSILGPAQLISAGSYTAPTHYTAPTDGFVIGSISHPGNADINSVTWITACSNTVSLSAVGGNASWLSANGKSWDNFSNNSSLTLPVRKGEVFSVSIQNGSGTTPAPTGFWWKPIGVGAVTALSDEEVKQLGDKVPPLPRAPMIEKTVLKK